MAATIVFDLWTSDGDLFPWCSMFMLKGNIIPLSRHLRLG